MTDDDFSVVKQLVRVNLASLCSRISSRINDESFLERVRGTSPQDFPLLVQRVLAQAFLNESIDIMDR